MHTTPGFTPAVEALGVLFMPGVLVSLLVAGKGQALHFLVPWWSHVLDHWLPGCYYCTTGHTSSALWCALSAMDARPVPNR